MNILSVGFSLIKELGARFDEIGPLLDQESCSHQTIFPDEFCNIELHSWTW